MYLDVVTFIYKLLNLNLQDAFHLWTCLHLCVNWSVFVCELVCICVWIFETLLTWLDSQMHFFQQGTLCNQSDAFPHFQPIGERRSSCPHTDTIPFSSCRCSESKPKFLSPNSISVMAEIIPTTSLYWLWKYQRIGDLTHSLFIISENIPVSSATAQWMNKDRKHVRRKKHLFWQMCPKLLRYNLFDDQHLEKHVLLIQPRVNFKCSVFSERVGF